MVRFKYRYFTVEIKILKKQVEPGRICSPGNVLAALRNKVQELHGDYGVGAMHYGLYIKYSNPDTQIILIRVLHGAHRFVASAIPLINTIRTEPVSLKTLYVGATIRQCFLYIQKYQKQELKAVWNTLTEKERKALENAFMKIHTEQNKSNYL